MLVKKKDKEEQELVTGNEHKTDAWLCSLNYSRGRTYVRKRGALQYGGSLIFDKWCDIYSVRLKDGGRR